jgi:hypothetical protein
MEVCAQFHAPVALLPGEDSPYPMHKAGLQGRSGRGGEDNMNLSSLC